MPTRVGPPRHALGVVAQDAADLTLAAEYHEALRALTDRGRYGIRLGLGRIRALLREIGDPQLEFRGALIAGTNGKGSVLALASSALRAGGDRKSTRLNSSHIQKSRMPSSA